MFQRNISQEEIEDALLNGETWTVIEAEWNNLKLVSTENVGTQILAFEDSRAMVAIKTNESTPTDAEKLERSIWSYNCVK